MFKIQKNRYMNKGTFIKIVKSTRNRQSVRQIFDSKLIVVYLDAHVPLAQIDRNPEFE